MRLPFLDEKDMMGALSVPVTRMRAIEFKKPVLSAVAFFSTVGILSVGYSAFVSNYPATATGSSQLSSTEWNKMVAALQTLDTNLSNFQFS